MNKRLLTLDDLVKFFTAQSESMKFDANENEELVVHVEGGMQTYESDAEEGLLKVKLQANHTGKNRNGSFISDEAQQKALESFKNRPILGYIHEVDGEPHFYGHNMHIEDNEVVYDEIPVGTIPESCDAKIVYDEEKGKSYVEVTGLIYEEYTKAAEIVRREEELPVSVELYIRSMSYDANEKALCLDDFYYSGVTILGKNDDGDDVEPGMEGANIQLADFSASNNAVFSAEGSVIAETEDNTENDVEVVEEVTETVEAVVEGAIVSEDAEITFDENDELVEDPIEEVVDISNDESGEHETTEEVEELNYSISNVMDAVISHFELTLDDVRSALYELVGTTYEDDWYGLAIYETYLVMHGWWNDCYYKQSYSRNGDTFSLDGERVRVYTEFVTAEEREELQNIRAEAESLKEEYAYVFAQLKEYQDKELMARKEAIFNLSDYSKYLNEKEFTALTSHLEDFSLEELETKAELAFAQCARKDIVERVDTKLHQFKAPEKKTVKKSKPYGGIFNDK